MLTYRLLEQSEWSRLEELIDGHGPVPPSEISAAAVVETEEGELVGVLFVQMVAHMEPFFVRPDHRDGKVSFTQLQELLDTEFENIPYYAFSPDAQIGKILKKVGMKQLPYRIWLKENGRRE